MTYIVTHTLTVKAVRTGKWTMQAWGGPKHCPYYEAKNLYVTVTETSAEVSDEPYFGQTTFTQEEILALTEPKKRVTNSNTFMRLR